jgi:hypothetical protein
MATRARIGIKQKSGRILSAYQHWDGYPGGLGYNLCENWMDPKKVTEAIKLGNSSKWGVVIGEKHDFDKDRFGSDFEHMNCYYMRDRGEKDQGPRVFKDEATYIRDGFNSGEEYIYLLKDVGEKDFLGKPRLTWHYVESRYTKEGKEVIDDAFKPVEEVAIQEHIESLQRYLKDKKERKAA